MLRIEKTGPLAHESWIKSVSTLTSPVFWRLLEMDTWRSCDVS